MCIVVHQRRARGQTARLRRVLVQDRPNDDGCLFPRRRAHDAARDSISSQTLVPRCVHGLPSDHRLDMRHMREGLVCLNPALHLRRWPLCGLVRPCAGKPRAGHVHCVWRVPLTPTSHMTPALHNTLTAALCPRSRSCFRLRSLFPRPRTAGDKLDVTLDALTGSPHRSRNLIRARPESLPVETGVACKGSALLAWL